MEVLTINEVMARSFVNTLQYTMVVDQSMTLFSKEVAVLQQFRMITDAQLSVLSSLASLVTSKAEVFAEYDRLMALLEARTGTKSATLTVMKEARVSLQELLDYSKGH